MDADILDYVPLGEHGGSNAMGIEGRAGGVMRGLEASTSAGAASLKRSAAEAFDDGPSDDEAATVLEAGAHRKKKVREDEGTARAGGEASAGDAVAGAGAVDGAALADGLEEELQCGCCSAIVYRPVVVAPCQHFFCGRCVWLPVPSPTFPLPSRLSVWREGLNVCCWCAAALLCGFG